MKHIFLIFLICFCAMSAHASDTLIANYIARGAGLHLMNGQMDLVMGKKDYKSLLQTETMGLLSVLLPAKTTFLTEGTHKENMYVIDVSIMTNVSGKKVKNRRINLADKKGFADYQTAVLTMMNLPKPQTKEFKIFDGKRELLVTFTYRGKERLESNKYSSFEGEADYYTVNIDITAGKKKGWFFNRMKDKTSPPLHVYFARLGENGEEVLVRGAFDTSIFGTITVYMTGLKQGEN